MSMTITTIICQSWLLWKDRPVKRLAGVAIVGLLALVATPVSAFSHTDSSIPVCVNSQLGTIRYTKTGKCKPKLESLVRVNTDGSPSVALSHLTYKVGDIGPSGGYIFYVDLYDRFPSFTYLEAAPAGWATGLSVAQDETEGSQSSDPLVHWCNVTNTLFDDASWAAAAVGTGKQHTAKAANSCTTGAIKMADNYSVSVNGKSYSDWFVPSLGEIMLMYTNFRQLGIGGVGPVTYWSSSEIDAEGALVQGFRTGGQGYDLKEILRSVRPIRMFG